MTNIVERLRAKAADNENWNGKVMQEWDRIRHQVETMKGSDIPRMNFESVIEDYTDIIREAADEIERLRAEIELVSK